MSGTELSKVPAEIVADSKVGNDADVTVTTHNDSDSRTHIHDGKVEYQASNSDAGTVSGEWSEEYDERVRQLVANAITQREARENKRANHRNFNRMLTLFGALVIGLIVTYGLEHKGIPQLGVNLPPGAVKWAPYSFVITVALDSLLALYSFIRHY